MAFIAVALFNNCSGITWNIAAVQGTSLHRGVEHGGAAAQGGGRSAAACTSLYNAVKPRFGGVDFCCCCFFVVWTGSH